MKHRTFQCIIIGLVSLTILSGVGLFLCRGAIARHVACQKFVAWSQQLGVNLSCGTLKMPSLTTLRIEDFSLVPEGRDTLLKLSKADIEVDLFSLLRGELSIRRMDTEGMQGMFVKQGAVSNYDFLFRKSSVRSSAGTHRLATTGYARQAEEVGKLLFRLLPEEGQATNISVECRRDSVHTHFYLHELLLKDHRFVSYVDMEENDLRGRGKMEGVIDVARHLIEGKIASAAASNPVALPYIRPHYGAVVEFDTLAFRLVQQQDNAGVQLLQGRAEVDGLKVFHAALSPDTIGLDNGHLDYVLRIGRDYVELDSTSTVSFNHLSFHPFIRAEKQGRWQCVASIHKPSFPAEELFASLPVALFRHLQGMQVSGELSYDFYAAVDFDHLDSLKFSSNLRGHDFRILRMGVTDLVRMSKEFDYTAYEHDVPVCTFAVGPSNPDFRPLGRISPLLRMAILQSEDGNFYYHDGFYPGAIMEALACNLKERRFARGGSSITMQLVKNVFLNRHKNIARKLEEVLMVWLIESQHLTSKDRMYEVYLNIIEWGPGVYGVAAASRFYFEKDPSDLTMSEAIYLASIIPKPKHFRSVFNPDASLRENQLEYYRAIAHRLAAKGLVSETEAESFFPDVQVKGEARRMIMERAVEDSLRRVSMPLP